MKRKIGIVVLIILAGIGIDSTIGTGIIFGNVFKAAGLASFVATDAILEHSNNFQVSSHSMEPALMKGEEVEVDRNIPFADIEVGDIMVFYSSINDDRRMVSRVVEVLDEDPYTLRTQGDSNPASIPGHEHPITENEYIGKVIAAYPNYESFLTGADRRNPYN